jgi:hypothetical protein
MVVVGKHKTGIDDYQVVAVLEYGHVLPDAVQTTQWNYLEMWLGPLVGLAFVRVLLAGPVVVPAAVLVGLVRPFLVLRLRLPLRGSRTFS